MERPVLVTGATGLLGHWLRRIAPEGIGIVALTHRRALQGISEVRADLRDRTSAMAAVQRINPSVIIHAAYARDREAIVNATEHVVEAAPSWCRRCLHIHRRCLFRRWHQTR